MLRSNDEPKRGRRLKQRRQGWLTSWSLFKKSVQVCHVKRASGRHKSNETHSSMRALIRVLASGTSSRQRSTTSYHRTRTGLHRLSQKVLHCRKILVFDFWFRTRSTSVLKEEKQFRIIVRKHWNTNLSSFFSLFFWFFGFSTRQLYNWVTGTDDQIKKGLNVA
jgi:hypothetical protein